MYPIGCYEASNRNCPLTKPLAKFLLSVRQRSSAPLFISSKEVSGLFCYRDISQQLSVASLPGRHRSPRLLPEVLQQLLLRVTTGSLQQPLRATVCGTVFYKCTSEGASSNVLLYTCIEWKLISGSPAISLLIELLENVPADNSRYVKWI